MQNLASNQQRIEYALYTGMEDIKIGDKKTGEKKKTYTTPRELWIYVSPAKGEAVVEPFGTNDEYTNVMSISDPNCPIKEDTILWIGVTSQNSTPHNYQVTKVARGLNSTLYAIKKVSVS